MFELKVFVCRALQHLFTLMGDYREELPSSVIELDEINRTLQKHGYTVSMKFATGSFGDVYMGKFEKVDVAIKVMHTEKLGRKYMNKFWPRQLNALKELQHPHIILTQDIFRSSTKLFICMEFAGGGNVREYLRKNGCISEQLTCEWFTQCLRAMSYVHDEKRWVHRDIKAEHVLLLNNCAKVYDFGFARHSPLGQDPISRTYCGTAPYYCPQIVRRGPYNIFGADCWAMGVLMFAMLNNKFPFHFEDSKSFYKEQTDANYIKQRYIKPFPTDLKNLQESFFIEDETERMTMANALKHPWIVRKGE